MEKKSSLFSKTLVIGIMILCISMSIVSSSRTLEEENPDNYNSLKIFDNSNEISSRGKIAYGYNAYPGPEAIVYFDLDDPGSIGELISIEPYPAGGTWTNNRKWLICDGNGALWEINLCELSVEYIGGGGISLNDISYDPVNEKLFGASYNDLYEIDIETGNQTYIGGFGSDPFGMVTIAFDEDGILYGCDIGTDSLWTIDTETGKASLVGSLGIPVNFVMSGHFYFETDTLYFSAYISTGQLYICDEDTGRCTLVGTIGAGVEVVALMIPYTDEFCPPKTTISLVPPEPDGLNGWYVSDVNVTLNATDDLSGVNATYYRIDGGEWEIYTASFTLSEDRDNILIEYYSVDNAGNEEDVKSAYLDIDQTVPDISLTYAIIGGNLIQGWTFEFTAIATDDMSGISYVEFYINDELKETVYGYGPTFTWSFVSRGNLFGVKSVGYDFAGNSAFDKVTVHRPKSKSFICASFLMLVVQVWFKHLEYRDSMELEYA